MTRIVAPGIVLLVAFLALGYWVSHGVPGIDATVAGATGDQWAGTPGRIATVLGAVLGPDLPIVALGALLVWAMVAWRRRHTDLAGLLVRASALLVLCRLTSLFKGVYARARPRDYPDWSFPSGHVVSVTSVAFTAIVLCAWLARPALRRCVVVSIAAVTLAAACRVVLAVHWLTDVLGGVLVVAGTGLLAARVLTMLPVRDGSNGSPIGSRVTT